MDKSFNDDELSDIMKEIEALEEDFSSKDEKSASPVMEELAEMDEEVSIPASSENIVSLGSKRTAAMETESKTTSHKNSTSMSFKVQGDLTLELAFDVGGKTISLEVTEAGLSIEMEGGVKFTVPVSEVSGIKKVA